LRATIGYTTSSDEEFPNDDFFPDANDLFGNLHMGNNTDATSDATFAAAATNAAPV
jgi:hypothetical protein